MSNVVPEGWQTQSLSDIAKFVMGQAPSGADCNKDGIGIPFVKAGEFTSKYPVIREWTTAPQKLAKSGDVLICVVGATAGKLNLGIDCAIGRSVAAIRPEKTSTLYLYNFMQQHVERLRTGSSGSAQGVITTEHLKNILAPFPPLPEQQKIAAILSSVDDVIEKTRAQIDKLKDLKTGMMQELLTKGIGSGGVPHTEFKDSPVGRIPAPWAVKTVGDLGAVVTGSTPKTASREYYGGSIPFISPSDINHSMYIRKTANSLTEAGLKETRELPAGTVCVVCIGSTIGKTGITTFRCATNQQVNAVICRGTHPEFVYYLLTYHSKVIKAEAGTQAVPIINKSSFSALPVQLPGYDEQVEIGNSIASVDSQTSFLERKLQSTTSLKKALMQDLLTGKVRVKVDQKESAVA